MQFEKRRKCVEFSQKFAANVRKQKNGSGNTAGTRRRTRQNWRNNYNYCANFANLPTQNEIHAAADEERGDERAARGEARADVVVPGRAELAAEEGAHDPADRVRGRQPALVCSNSSSKV